MFSNKDENYNILIGAYKKIKSYYYYNKNFLFMKKKIAEFESDDDSMEKSIQLLSDILFDSSKYEEKIASWIDQIDYYVLPKSFGDEKNVSSKFVTNAMQTNKYVNKVNFFINMPFELHLLETIWTLLVGKIVFDNNIVDRCCFGNCIDNYVVFSKESELLKSINFQKNRLFKIYFGQYCNWKNKAIETIDKNKKDKSMVMLSIDIKSFYYSVRWRFDLLDSILGDERIKEFSNLTKIIEMIYKKYTSIIGEIRILEQKSEKCEYVLPIGLFSSMLLANVYLSGFDKEMLSNENINYYGRYVDDMLFVIDVSKTGFECDEFLLDKLITQDNKILKNVDDNIYCIYNHNELLLQKDKLKVIFFECGKSNSLINQLRKTKIIPSQMNIVPDNDLKMTDFEEAAFIIQNFTTETKIRDFGQLEINRFKLGSHMSELVRNSRYKTKQLSKEDKINRQNEKDNIISFFKGSNALEYSSNWINALYFLMLTSSSAYRNEWKQFEGNVRMAIKELRIVQPEAIKKGKTNTLKSKMKKQLLEQFNICIASALALNLNFYKKESLEAKSLARKLRAANLYNHYLVTYPLINFADSLNEELDLTDIMIEQLSQLSFSIINSRKMKYTPRFINIDELFQFAFLESISHDNIWHLTEPRVQFIREVFYKINNIDTNFAKPLQIEIKNKNVFEDYYMQEICLEGQRYDLGKIRIAVANVKLEVDDCCMGLKSKEILRNRTDFINFLRQAYENDKGKVDFLLFPEYYLPLQWISDVLSFVRKSGITIITGLQYFTCGNQAHNTIGIFTQISSGRYKSSCMIIREKNDYAPLEKRILALKKYHCHDMEKPIYSIIKCGEISYGTFLCYEFTDVIARGLYKSKVDMLFTPENNKDTSYFSNIIETTTRDIHTFVIQANTSFYGDSRITGPYSRNQRNIVQIKGGDNDSIIIGTIDVRSVREDREKEKEELKDDIENYLKMNPKESYKKERELIGEKKPKASKISARTKY